MNPTIKARIESIRRGEVPEGYKRTKIGIVPNEWNVESLKSHLIEYRHLSNDIDKFDIYSSSRNGLMLQSAYYSPKTATQTNLGYKTVPNGYVTYRHMSDDDIFHFNINRQNKTILVSAEYPVFDTDDQTNTYFLITYLNSMARFRYFCRGQKMGGTRTRLYFNVLGDFKLAFPSISEQEKIAEILAGQDRVIALKEKLLAEKQKQKKYLMQQLFSTGINAWVRLSEVAGVIMGQAPDSQFYNDKKVGIPLLQGNADMQDGYPIPRLYTATVTKKCEIGDILLSVRAPVGSVFRSNIIACIGRGLCAIRSSELQEYIYHFLTFYEEKWRAVAQGSTFEAISGNDIKNLLIPIVEEKDKVCMILSTADKEIELLKKDIEQEKLKKKSLMQLLLTGMVRVL